jgi:hypothetical protein
MPLSRLSSSTLRPTKPLCINPGATRILPQLRKYLLVSCKLNHKEPDGSVSELSISRLT